MPPHPPNHTALMRALFSNTPDGLLAVGPSGEITFASPRLGEMFGYAVADLLGLSVEQLVPARYRTTHPGHRASAAGSAPREMGNAKRVFALRKDGTEFPVAIALIPLAPEDGGGTLCVVRDLTRVCEIEERLARAQRLEAIGTLAAGIAHDFNNLLTVILGAADQIASLPDITPAALPLTNALSVAGTRAADLTDQLLTYGGRQTLLPIVCDLNELVRASCDLLTIPLRGRLRVVLRTHPEPLRVSLDKRNLQLSLLNLALNANDASPRGGTLTVRTFPVEPNGIEPCPKEPTRSWAVISVRDTGQGMDAPTLSRAFEPFFTTKPVGKGTGLGLSAVYGFVRQSGGHIEVESALGVGTEFRLCFPRISETGA